MACAAGLGLHGVAAAAHGDGLDTLARVDRTGNVVPPWPWPTRRLALPLPVWRRTRRTPTVACPPARPGPGGRWPPPPPLPHAHLFPCLPMWWCSGCPHEDRGLEGDCSIGLDDGRASELGRGGSAAGAGAAQLQSGTTGEGLERNEHANSEEEEEVVDENSPFWPAIALVQPRRQLKMCGFRWTIAEGTWLRHWSAATMVREVGAQGSDGNGSVARQQSSICEENADGKVHLLLRILQLASRCINVSRGEHVRLSGSSIVLFGYNGSI